MTIETHSDPQPLLYRARLTKRAEGALYILQQDWMAAVITGLRLPRAVLPTYATLWSLAAAGLTMRIRDVQRFVPAEARSIQRHVRMLEGARLVKRQPRYRERRQVGNEYEFLFHPAMPAELRGDLYVAGVAPTGDVDDGEGDDTGGSPRVTRMSGQFSSASGSDDQAGKQSGGTDVDLPPQLREALERAAPRHWHDCLRVLREEARKLDPERRRPVVLIALRKLIERCEKVDVGNPPGLLRASLLPDAAGEADAALAVCRGRQRALVKSDLALARISSGFGLIRAMRKRQLEVTAYVREHLDVFGVEPADVPALMVSDAGVAELLIDVNRLLDVVRDARQRGDAEAARDAEEGLRRLEEKLDRLVGRGGVEEARAR